MLSDTPTNLLVNKVAKYLYKHIDSSEKIKFDANKADVIFCIYFQEVTRTKSSRKSEEVTFGELQEMKLDLSLTTYSNKIRCYVAEISPDETTLFFKVYDPAKFSSLEDIRIRIFKDTETKLTRLYDEYEFLI